MSELTPDQRKVLGYVEAFEPRGPGALRTDLRYAFWELEKLGMIIPITRYHLTETGEAEMPPRSPQETAGE